MKVMIAVTVLVLIAVLHDVWQHRAWRRRITVSTARAIGHSLELRRMRERQGEETEWDRIRRIVRSFPNGGA